MQNSGWHGWQQLCMSLKVIAVLLLSATVLTAPSALALGLGEIDARSALNERFAAQIELLDTRDLDESEVIASLASTDDFRRVGVERFFFLTSLKFDVVRSARGNLVIKATSAQPITEPYLNFLVEVLWPSGRLLKEYTVLLDPPTFTHSTAAPVAAPSRESSDIASAGRVQRNQPEPAATAPASPRTTAAGTRVRSPTPKVSSSDGTYGRTTRNDTLWAIANQTLPSSNVTPQQNMLAIQRLNPDAFIDGNVNLLKAGVVLRLPTEADAKAVDGAAAVEQIDLQNRAWRAGTPARSVATTSETAEATAGQSSAAAIDATSRGPGRAEAGAKTAEGRLTIVATDAAGVVDGLDNTGADESQTSVAGDPAAQERIESLARQVDELTYQLDLQKRGVEEQISTREKQLNLKDQQIAQLQQQLKAAREAVAAQPQDQTISQQPVPAEAKPFWQQPTVLGAVLGGLALLLAGVLFKRRQASAANDLDLDDFESREPSFELRSTGASEVVTPLIDADLAADLSEADSALNQAANVRREADLADQLSTALDDDELSDDDLFGPSDDVPAPVSAHGAAQTSDVIGEADIYIAYGRYPQAIALLLSAVESNPADHAVRMRLLEVSAETKDAESYAEQSRLLQQYCDDDATLEAAQSLYLSLDSDLRDQIDALADAVTDDKDDSLLSDLSGLGVGAVVAAGSASLLLEDSDDPEVAEPDDDFSRSDDLAELADNEFELDLDLDGPRQDADQNYEIDIPSVDTDEFATNVSMAPVDLDLGFDGERHNTETETETETDDLEDFEFDLDLESDAESLGDLAGSLGGDLGIDFPDETSELARVVAEADDDLLLDEIERSLDELEADGLLVPELNEEVEFSFDDDADTSATKLDLARAYIDMGDDDGAREILDEVLSEGDPNQKDEASELLDKL